MQKKFKRFFQEATYQISILINKNLINCWNLKILNNQCFTCKVLHNPQYKIKVMKKLCFFN